MIWFLLMQLVGIVIPVVGVISLLQLKHPGGSAVRLMLASLGCAVMNSGALLMAAAQTEAAAGMALKFQYLGNAIFFPFFVTFVLSYLQIRIPHALGCLWALFESAMVGFYWMDHLQEQIFGHFNFVRDNVFQVFRAETGQSPLMLLRYGGLALLLTVGLLLVLSRMFRINNRAERVHLRRVAGAQLFIVLTLLMQVLLHPRFDFIPVLSSLSLVSLVISMLTDGFFGIMDSGHEWVFAQMENAYILADTLYGYVDANAQAKVLFPELNQLQRGMPIPAQLHKIFAANVESYELNGCVLSRKVTEIQDRGSLVGYGMLLEDITARQRAEAMIADYNNRLRDEVTQKTDHIRKVQNSIITGMASVVESRDNSTGGHINRTSAVVRIFAERLREHPEIALPDERFLHNVAKAAPMHDIGKIAVDDDILCKPGKFTDAEYEEMKKHAAEGAKILRKVLHEVDDENFVKIAVNVAHYHHEKWNGAGYPCGLSSTDIPLEARIMALADVFDALVSKRCYKSSMDYDRAFGIIEKDSGSHFDPVLDQIFLECRPALEDYYNQIAAEAEAEAAPPKSA